MFETTNQNIMYIYEILYIPILLIPIENRRLWDFRVGLRECPTQSAIGSREVHAAVELVYLSRSVVRNPRNFSKNVDQNQPKIRISPARMMIFHMI